MVRVIPFAMDAVGKRVFLWCGGVDEKARVWVNGQEIGNSPGASFYPFEMDATAAVTPGTNMIAVCISNSHVNELGTGGIVAPVILIQVSACCPASGRGYLAVA